MDTYVNTSLDDSYSDYEKKAEAVREKNNEYLDAFGERLLAQGLSVKTINKHTGNVDFYINTFLLYYEVLDVTHGCYKVDEFLGGWFIRKAMWSNAESIKSNITSFKKFFSYLLDINVIASEDYDELCATIAENKDDWLDLVNSYNDPTEDNPFSFF